MHTICTGQSRKGLAGHVSEQLYLHVCSSGSGISMNLGLNCTKIFIFLQKLKIRTIGLDGAAQMNGWSDAYKEKMQKLLSVDYMSSESSAKESETEGGTVARSFLRVKRIPWLKKKYREAFHAIDKAYYSTHRRSRDKLKRRVQSGNSTCSLSDDTPRFSFS